MVKFWFAGSSSNVNSIYRLYYEETTGQWAREDRKGGMSAQLLYCSTKTDSTGRLFCGYGALSTGGGGTRYVETNPPGTLTNCINLGGSGVSTNVRGVAVDGARGFVYFAHYYSNTVEGYIKKIDTACNEVLDSDYGNQNGSWGSIWNPIVGMAVDETNGDLYIAAKTAIYKVDLQENVTIVKSGFGNIYGIDIVRESAQDIGILVVADTGAGKVKAIALDNLSSSPIEIANASNLRAVLWGRKPGMGKVPSSEDSLTLSLHHNNGNNEATSPVRANAFIEVWPRIDSEIWISAPEGGRNGTFPQGYIRESYPPVVDKSTAIVRMQYKDNKERYTCARTGDPGKAAIYDPEPQNLANCDVPYSWVDEICDNKDNFSGGVYGVGSFIYPYNTYVACKDSCGSDTNPCKFEFWITSRYAGDNYKVYFQTFQDNTIIFLQRASPIYTAVKHVHIEEDKMCA